MNKNPNFYWQSSPQAVLEVNSFQTQAFSILLTIDQHPWWITRLISHTHQPQGSVIHTSISCGARDMWVPAAHHGQWQKHWLLENPLTRARHLPITFSVTWVGQSYFKMTGMFSPRTRTMDTSQGMGEVRQLSAWVLTWPVAPQQAGTFWQHDSPSFLSMATIPGPGMFYRMAAWAWPRGLLQMSNLDSLHQNLQGLWTLHDS